MKKSFATETTPLKKVFKGISDGIYYTNQAPAYRAHGFELMTVDINASEFDINIRHNMQTVQISMGKRGNLAKYAGQMVDVICTNVSSRGGARIEFWIRKHK